MYKNFVLFDFDYMLLLFDSDQVWSCFIMWVGQEDDVYMVLIDEYYGYYVVGMFDMDVYFVVMFVLFMCYLCEQFECWYVQFMDEVIWLVIMLQVCVLVDWYCENGDFCCIVMVINVFVM